MEDKCLKIVEQYRNSQAFKKAIGLDVQTERSILFENGFQWRTDADLDDYTKITLNIIKQNGEVQTSNIMQNEYGYLVNSTNFVNIRKLQDFLKYLSNLPSVNLKRKDIKVMKDDYTKGVGFTYFFWDKQKTGYLRKSGGNMRCKVVDQRNLAVANDYETDIQDQEWIIYSTREKIGALKKEFGEDKNIVPDGENWRNKTEKEKATLDINEESANVYIKFYRNEEGQVITHIVTETCELRKPTALQPFYKGNDFEEQPSTMLIFDTKDTSKSEKKARALWNLYPFARLCLNERDNCFWGVPRAFEYIEAQKSINNHYSVYDKAIQDNVLGGFIYREGVVDPEEVTTDNGQMIGLKGVMPNEKVSDVFARFPVANVPNDSHRYASALISDTRSVAGASNVQLGQSDFAGQSGKQTQLLLERARENTSVKALLFNEYKKDQAYIMFLFAKFYYDNEDFTITEHGQEKDNVRTYMGDNKFNGEEWLEDDVVFDIKVGTAPSFSEYNNIEMLGMMVQSGQAPLEAYLTGAPDGYFSNRQEMLQVLKENSLKQMQALQQQIEEQRMMMEQMAQAYQQTQKDRQNIDTLVRENERLQSMLGEVSAKAVEKVQEATRETQAVTQDVKSLLDIAQRR